MTTGASHSPAIAAEAPPALPVEELERALPCPLCDYDLRAQFEPRCPECGHAFDRAELRAAQRLAADRPMPWLVEYPPPHPLGLLRNLLLTPLLTLRPLRFWRRLRPSMRVMVPRLALYAFVSHAMLVIAVVVALIIEPNVYYGQKYLEHLFTGTMRGQFGFPWMNSGWGYWWSTQERLEAATGPLVVLVIWPWLTLGILASFRASLRQARVKRGHLFRCVTYSADMAIPAAAVTLASSAFVVWWVGELWDGVRISSLATRMGSFDSSFLWAIETPSPLLLTVAALLAWFALRLCVAYRRYLGFPHAIATVLSSQVILWLALIVVWLQSLNR